MTATTTPTDTGRSRPHAPPVASRPAKPTGPSGPAGRRPGKGSRGGAHDRSAGDAPARQAHVTPLDPDTAGSGFRTADPRALAYGFAHLYLEVECGRRPARQLAALMDPGLHARLELVWVRLHQPLATIRHVHATQQDRKIDAVVVVQRGRRVGAIALELSWIAGRWYVTAAVRPEDGPLPPAPFTVPAGDVLEAVPGCEGLGGDGRQPDGRLEQRPGTDAPAALVAPAA